MSKKQLTEYLEEVKNKDKREFFKFIGYEPLSKAIPFHNSEKKIRVILGGMRAGKSSACVPETAYVLTFPKKNIWIVGINYDKTDRFMEGAGRVNGVLNYIKKFPGLFKTKRKKDHLIILNNGSTIKGKSVKNPDGFVAEPVDLIVCEDASSYPDGFYDAYIRPRVADTGGRIIINSVPPIKKNWLTKLFQLEKDNLQSFHWTMEDNIHVPRQEVEQLKNDLPEFLANSIIFGKMPEEDSAIFGNLENNIRDYEELPYIDGHIYQAGVDIGKVRDRTVLTITDLTDGVVAYIDRFPERMFKTDVVAERILAGLEKYKFPNCYIDISGIGSIYETLVDKYNFFIPFTIPNVKVRNSLIENLAIAFQRGLTIPNNKDLIAELKNLEVIVKMNFHIYKPAQGYHDDMIISLALSVRGWIGRSVDRKRKFEYHIISKPKNYYAEHWWERDETLNSFIDVEGEQL